MNPVILKIKDNSKIITIPWRADMNVQEALETACDQEKKAGRKFDFALQYFGYYNGDYMGYFVIMIDKIYDNPNNASDYWLYSVNGTMPSAGIDNYMVNAGDIIEFDYIGFSSATHSETSLAVKHTFYNAN
jgi:Domain of unknown function (DUF4430)